MSSSLNQLIFGSGGDDNDGSGRNQDYREADNSRNRPASSKFTRREGGLDSSRIKSEEVALIPTVRSSRQASKADKRIRFDLPDNEKDGGEDENDDWNEDDFEELDDDEIGSAESPNGDYLQPGVDKRVDWRSTIDQQAAFMSALYTSYSTRDDDADSNMTATISHADDDDDDESNIRKIEAVLRPEVVEHPLQANLLPERAERLKPQVRKRKRRKKGVSGFVTEETLETEKQARYRVAMQDRSKEWRLMKGRWKRRQYDYSNENDVGNAIGFMGRQVVSQRKLDRKMKKRQLRRRRWVIEQKLRDRPQHYPKQETTYTLTGADKQETDENQEFQLRQQYPLAQDAPSDAGVVVEADGDDDNSDEGSLDEQKQVLNRLLQNSASQEERPSDVNAVEDDFEKVLVLKERPFQDQFNFWELGRSIPTARDLEFCYGRERQTTTKAFGARKSLSPQQKVADDDDNCRLTMTLRQFVNIKGGSKSHDAFAGVANPRWYYPLPSNETSGSEKDRGGIRAKFVHQRHLRRMAARFLCGGKGIASGSSDNRLVEDRLLRALHSMAPGRGDGFDGRRDWNNRHRYFFHYSHRKHLLLHLARQRALDVKCFIENIWSNQSLVAARLGLIQHRNCQDYPHQLAGHSMDLHRVQSMSRRERTKIAKSKKLRKAFRILPVSKPKEDEEEHDSKLSPGSVAEHEEPVSGLRVDGVESLNAPTSDAVVSDLRSMTSATKSSVTSTKEYFKASYLSGLTLIGTVSSDYVHLEGTVPPVPVFPLDPTGIVFGPVDRYAGFHHMAKLDETTVALTISTFVSRMTATTRCQSKNDKQAIYSKLLSYLKQAPGLDLTNFYKFLARTKSKMQDLPLVNSYNAVTVGCSFVANSGFLYSNTSSDEGKSEKHGGDDDDDSLFQDDDAEKSDASSNAGMNVVASRIHDHCESSIRHNGLLRFPQLHLTFAIARLCRLLPDPAAEILSRSTDDADARNSYCRTPVDLMRLTLLYLENNHLIEEGGPTLDSEQGAIQVGLLEYRLYEAADVFRRCMKLDFFALDYHLWYISALSACVLLSSGNQIGSGARRFPSTRSKNQGEHSYFDQPLADGIPEHEVRSKLPKFEDVREELRCAIRLLLDLAQHQTKQLQCWTKTHLAIASVFEWKQVMALVVGDTAGSGQVGGGPWSEIRAVHQYHASRWAIRDRSSCAREYAAHLISHVDKNKQLSLVAQDLESDPSNLDHWRRLVGELGPIGRPIGDSEESIAHKSTCPDCKRIRNVLIIDHHQESERRNQKGWWASDRISWWDCSLLQMPQFEGRRSTVITDTIDKKMSACDPPVADNADIWTSTDLDDNLHEENITKLHNLSWLIERHNDDDDDELKPPSDRERTKQFDQVLPQPFREVLNSPSPFPSEHSSSGHVNFDEPKMNGPNAPALEALCYKILITCHIHGVNHPSIEPAIWSIVMSCWENKNYAFADSDEWTALTWLSSRGLNIPQCLRDGCPD